MKDTIIFQSKPLMMEFMQRFLTEAVMQGS